MARLLAQLIHSTIVFLAMYLVVWHAWRINQHTLKLAQLVREQEQFRRDEDQKRKTKRTKTREMGKKVDRAQLM